MPYKYHHKDTIHFTIPYVGREPLDVGYFQLKPEGIISIVGTPDKPFSWDGCSPKIKIKLFGRAFFLGTWDGKKVMHNNRGFFAATYFASMVHDAIYFNKSSVDLSRSEADWIFYKMLREVKFPLSGLYYVGVRLFGWFYGSWKKK